MSRALADYTPESEALGPRRGRVGDERSQPHRVHVFNEADEMELAGGLLDTMSERELERFLRSLISRAALTLGAAVQPVAGKSIRQLLKITAEQALPGVGGAPKSQPSAGRGALAGAQVSSTAGRLFGLELEGLSPEDRVFEVARGLVRLAGDTVGAALALPKEVRPELVAQSALIQSAQRNAPGLLGRAGAPTLSTGADLLRPHRSGTWIKAGRNIVLNAPERP